MVEVWGQERGHLELLECASGERRGSSGTRECSWGKGSAQSCYFKKSLWQDPEPKRAAGKARCPFAAGPQVCFFDI